MTWEDRVALAVKRLGRSLTSAELLALGREHRMTPGEKQMQRESWVRSMKPTGDPRFD